MRLHLSWESSAPAIYEVLVNGQVAGRTSETSYSVEVRDRDYHYEVRVVEGGSIASGGASFCGEGEVDATAPTIRLRPALLGEANGDIQKVTLRWYSSESATYTVTLSNEDVYSDLKRNSLKLELPTGKYTYTVEGTDKAGNTSEKVQSQLEVDAAAPIVQLDMPVWEKKDENNSTVSFS